VATFDHARTRFALLGRHARIECNACHRSAVYREAPRECAGCHEADDKHRGALGRDCAACHNARDWRLWEFDHRRTSFALDGAHASIACSACHVAAGPGIAKLTGACNDCHARDDIHHGAFGPLCERCHVRERSRDPMLVARRPDAVGRPRDPSDPARCAARADLPLALLVASPAVAQGEPISITGDRLCADRRHLSAPCESCHVRVSGARQGLRGAIPPG
jgi:hypothetical protein